MLALVAAALFTIAWAADAGAQAASSPPLPRIAIEDDATGAAARVLEQTPVVPVLVRTVLTGLQPDATLDARLRAFESRRIGLWLAVPVYANEGELEGWRLALTRLLDRHASSLAVLEVAIDRQPDRIAAFALQVAATEARARQSNVRIAIGGPAMDDRNRRSAIYSQALAPYVDLLAIHEPVADAAEWLERVDPGAHIALSSTGTTSPDGAAETLIDGVVQDLGTAVRVHAWSAAVVTLPALQALSPLSQIISHEMSVLDPEAVGLQLTQGSTDVSRSLRHRLLFDTETFSTLLVYWGTASDDPLQVSVRVPIEGTPAVVDLLRGTRAPAAGYSRDAASEQARATVPVTGHPMLVNFNEGGALGDTSVVSAERSLTVGEIISRHQQQQLTQDRLVRHYIADARMRQSFRPTITDAGYDVVTQNRYYVADDVIEWEQLTFSVNNRTFKDPLPYPLVQPEKVLALPLQLRFDEGYTYELEGTERVDGFDCYKVRFEPVRDDAALYRGNVWIDRRTFARVRVHAVQGGLPGVVVSNDETQRYLPVATIENRPVFLFSSLTGRQIMLMAGRNILVEKSVTFSGFRVNDEAFEHERAAARESERTMYRETAGGLRYLVKRDGQRVVSDRPTEAVKAMALGVIVDPSYAFPLPIFGINYIDFSFGNPNTQLALLFGGVLAAGNIQRPQLGSKRLDASLDFFAIAAPSSDRVYVAGGEVESERVLTWPMSTGLNLGWKVTPFHKLSLQYQFRFDAYVRDTTTAETFQVPSSTITNGLGGVWEYSRGGYTVTLNGTWYARGRWKPWGPSTPEEPALPTPSDYAKYGATISREFVLNLFQKVNVNAAWFGGKDLDRFVQYQFGLFDATKVHGVPSGVRFGELAVARGSYSLNIFNQYRLDLFMDQAWGRDQPHDSDWQLIPGVGAAFNLPGPWNTILRADIGRSWLPDRYRSLGSTALQVMLLKPMK